MKWCLQRKADAVFIRRPIFTGATNKSSALMRVRSGHYLVRSCLGVSAHWLAFGNEDDSDAVPLRGKGESTSPYAARKSVAIRRDTGLTARDSGARAERMLLKFERLTFKQQAILLTLADALLLTVRGWFTVQRSS
jgi:hypothetical protein